MIAAPGGMRGSSDRKLSTAMIVFRLACESRRLKVFSLGTPNLSFKTTHTWLASDTALDRCSCTGKPGYTLIPMVTAKIGIASFDRGNNDLAWILEHSSG